MVRAASYWVLAGAVSGAVSGAVTFVLKVLVVTAGAVELADEVLAGGVAVAAGAAALVEEVKVASALVVAAAGSGRVRLDGSRGMPARKAEAFARGLESALQARVVLWDERFSTSAAEQSLRESGVRGSRRREVVDQSAAALILQSFLDAEGS